MKLLFHVPMKQHIWLQQIDGFIRFPRKGCFRHLQPKQTYVLQTRIMEHDVVDLTWSPPKRQDTRHSPPPLEPGATPQLPHATHSGAGQHMSTAMPAPTPARHCYICLGEAVRPVMCVECKNVVGCLTHVLELSEHDGRCPICKKECIIRSCIEWADET